MARRITTHRVADGIRSHSRWGGPARADETIDSNRIFGRRSPCRGRGPRRSWRSADRSARTSGRGGVPFSFY